MRHKIGDKQRLKHILKALKEIDNYTGGFSTRMFFENSVVKSACVYQLQVVGEAANHLTRALRSAHQEVQWQQIIGLRNIVVHEYWGIDFPQVWNIFKQELPAFTEQIEAILTSLSDADS